MSDRTPESVDRDEAVATRSQRELTTVPMVLAISVDGLTPDALDALGTAGVPTFWRLAADGASTFDARAAVEKTTTMPNHTGMLTGRRVSAARGGHGFTANDDTGEEVVDPDGTPVPSVFDTVADAGLSTALFANKDKFAVFDRSWPSIDRYLYRESMAALVAAAARDLVRNRRAFTFLHLAAPDQAGHANGWMTPSYLAAVRATDRLLGSLIATIDSDRYLRRHLVLILTADHGGEGLNHVDRTRPGDYTVPFLVRGPGVPAAADLYDVDATRKDPGNERPGYGRRQPVRNADVANLATSLLGLGTVPTSQIGVDPPLTVQAPPG